MPFICIRDENHLMFGFGALTESQSLGTDGVKVSFEHEYMSAAINCHHCTRFHREHAFDEVMAFAFDSSIQKVCVRVKLHSADGKFVGAAHTSIIIDDVRETIKTLTFADKTHKKWSNKKHLSALEAGAMKNPIGSMEVRIGYLKSSEIAIEGERLDHPYNQHSGGKSVGYSDHPCSKICYSQSQKFEKWNPARTGSMHAFEGMELSSNQTWMVPSPKGWVPDHVAPPCANVTAIYGVNVRTARAIFLRHRAVHHTGGLTQEIKPALELDTLGDADGMCNPFEHPHI